METLARERQRAVDLNMPHYCTLHNVGLYLLVFERDFAVFKYDALYSADDWRRNVALRHIALMVYEASEDLAEMLGKNWRATLSEFPLDDTHWKALNGITHDVTVFKDANRAYLKVLRNFATAHRDHDASRQIEFIEGVDHKRTLDIAGDLYDIIRALVALLIEITTISGDGRVILRHMLQRESDG